MIVLHRVRTVVGIAFIQNIDFSVSGLRIPKPSTTVAVDNIIFQQLIIERGRYKDQHLLRPFDGGPRSREVERSRKCCLFGGPSRDCGVFRGQKNIAPT